MFTSIDQLGQELVFQKAPRRVISLVPSITEFLIDLGVEVVGRTKFCIHPTERVYDISMIGGTKNFRFEIIDQLQPDLIVGNKEENYPEGIHQLSKKYPVWMSEVFTISDSLAMMTELSQLLGSGREGERLIHLLKDKYRSSKQSKKGSAVYLIWRDPWMAVGVNTFIDHMLTHHGFDNAIGQSRYPTLSVSQLKELQPEIVFLSSEPYPFKKKHLKEISALFPNSEIRLVNGEYYSWYGTRFLKLYNDQMTGK